MKNIRTLISHLGSVSPFLFPSLASCVHFEEEGIGSPSSLVKFSFCCLQSHDSVSTWGTCGKGYGDNLYVTPVPRWMRFSVVRFTQPCNISFRQRASDQHSAISDKQLSSYKPPSFRKEDENVKQSCQKCRHPYPWSHRRQNISRPL